MAQAPFDRRRVNGPDESTTPFFEIEDEDEAGPSSTRIGRSPADIRPIFLKPGLITQANGSAYIETEKTKIVCAVYGPRQSKSSTYHENGRLNVEVKFAPFSCTKRRKPFMEAEDRDIALQVQQSLLPSLRLELLPKSTIDVFINVIENDGMEGCIAAGSIAASAALADARIEMLGLVMSCSAASILDDLWLDPNHMESHEARGTFVLSCMPALGVITNIWQNGQMSVDDTQRCIDACQECCTNIHSVVAQALLNSVSEAGEAEES